jgi:aminoglycoside phosphotransferase (APT) family kinase protein
LLTGGRRSIGKVVALPFSRAVPVPELVVKFARVPEADAALEREASVLRELTKRRPPNPGAPRVLAVGRRVGRVAVAESAIHGTPLTSQLTAGSFGELARLVTGWLADLVVPGFPAPRAGWEARLVSAPLEDFRHRFEGAVDRALVDAIRARLETLRSLPLGFEHRDCAPWNVTLTADGKVALLDWESAEPLGLPGTDLTYFLANAAFLVEGSFESGRTRETYSRLLNPGTAIGSLAAECERRYCERLRIDAQSFTALRLLCWIVHSRSEHERIAADSAGAPSLRALRESAFLGLIREELDRS